MDCRKSRSFLAALAAAVLLAPSARADNRTPQIPDLKVEKYTLPNGLEVILHEDHTTPIVGVNIWYKVGSKNEKTGRTGFAHLFEHLMFQGSKNHDDEYFGPLEKVGAQINGSTSTDRTNYFENVPSNVLELALWEEADRMGFLLPALTQAKLDNQRDVVKNERRQRVDNVPYGQSHEALLEAFYPPDHPYHHSVIGSMADLSAASLDDVSSFFRTYYSPNNASLCIAGDFKPEEAKKLVEKYFGPLPKGPEVAKLEPSVPVLKESKHLKLTDRVTLPRAELVWPTGQRGDADEQALDVLSLVLGGIDKENRLFRALMYDKQLAARVSAGHPASALAGEFTVTIYARPGQSLDKLVEIADAEIERLKKDGPTLEEVTKAQNTQESELIIGLQSAGRKADYLNNYNVEFGDPLAYKAEMIRLFKVTPEDVKRVANQYLTKTRIRLDVTPGAPTPRAPEVEVDRSKQAPIESPKIAEVKDTFDRSVMPKIGPTPDFTPPAVTRRTLSNGLEVLVAERHELPILTLSLVLKGGDVLVPPAKHGLASLTADLLTEGTKNLDSLAFAGALSEIGASIDANGGLEASSLSLTTLTKHIDRGIELYSDVLLNPSFPEKELKRLSQQRLSMIQARLDRAEGISGVVFPRLLYGEEHPYGRPDMGTAKSIASITRDDIVKFHEQLFKPNNATLIVVGDTSPDAIVATLEKSLKEWKPGEAVKRSLPEAPAAKPLTVYLVDKPAAAQSVLAVGFVGQPRGTPDYFPLTIMNAVLGGQFSSRINLNLREAKGYSYGVRSHFAFRIGPGPFEAGGSVQTAVTKEALFELMKEIEEISGARPVTDEELAFAKDRTIKGFPGKFETTFGVAGTLADLVLYSLPNDYFTTYPGKVEAVTKEDVDRVAKKYLDTKHMTILVVGDRSKIEAKLKTLPYAQVITVLDPEGNPLPASGSDVGSGSK
ncbi:M16 family metallopeptidase [Singulisphaera sp. PoT]|uniref:M16 family metallopeptidase n=1 Tax=Singulisphaera sp. PoT TaxID=3411797 RepID=UPI003BF4B10B